MSDSICPACDGRPERERIEETDEAVTFITELCEVCEQTGRVSRELARAWWLHPTTPASA